MENLTPEGEDKKKETTPPRDGVVDGVIPPEADIIPGTEKLVPGTNPGYSPKENYEITILHNAKILLADIQKKIINKEHAIMGELSKQEAFSVKISRYNDLVGKKYTRTAEEQKELDNIANELREEIKRDPEMQELLAEQERRQENVTAKTNSRDKLYVTEY